MENKDKITLKLYGMLLEIKDTYFLSMQYAKSLEDAINQAKLEFIKINPPVPGAENSLIGLKLGLYTIKTIDTLMHESKTYDFKRLRKVPLTQPKPIIMDESVKEPSLEAPIKKIEISPAEIKNMIMKEIMDKKDMKMLEQNKNIFNDNEVKYMKGHIKKKIK